MANYNVYDGYIPYIGVHPNYKNEMANVCRDFLAGALSFKQMMVFIASQTGTTSTDFFSRELGLAPRSIFNSATPYSKSQQIRICKLFLKYLT